MHVFTYCKLFLHHIIKILAIAFTHCSQGRDHLAIHTEVPQYIHVHVYHTCMHYMHYWIQLSP